MANPLTNVEPFKGIKKKKKIAIVGGTESWEEAPFDDHQWEIWVLGNQVQMFDHKRIDMIFEIHNDFSNRESNYAEWLASLEFPMVVGEEYPIEGELIEKFDFAKAREMIGGNNLTSTPAYMIAYAHYARPDLEEIGFWGVDMAVDDTEYFYEQPCVKEWIGYSRGKGVKIFIPPGCPLGEPGYMEGVTGNKPEGKPPYTEQDFLAVAKRHADSIEKLQAQINEIQVRIHTHDGARQVYDKLAQVGRATDAGQEFGDLTQALRTKT